MIEIILAFIVGVIVGLIITVNVESKALKKSIDSKFIMVDGVVYKIEVVEND